MADMEDIADLLQSILSSEDSSKESENSDTGKNEGQDFFSGIDLDMIMKIGEIMSKMQEEDKNTSLLVALKPHMRPENQDKIDTAIRLLRMIGLIPYIKEMGLMDKIF